MRGGLPISRRSVFKLRQVGIGTLGSAKIKILLCGCVVLSLLAIANRNRDGSAFMGWTGDSDLSSSPRCVSLLLYINFFNLLFLFEFSFRFFFE